VIACVGIDKRKAFCYYVRVKFKTKTMAHKKINVQYTDSAPEIISFRLEFEDVPSLHNIPSKNAEHLHQQKMKA
jgi:uncharacterized protein (DUF111 family)